MAIYNGYIEAGHTDASDNPLWEIVLSEVPFLVEGAQAITGDQLASIRVLDRDGDVHEEITEEVLDLRDSDPLMPGGPTFHGFLTEEQYNSILEVTAYRRLYDETQQDGTVVSLTIDYLHKEQIELYLGPTFESVEILINVADVQPNTTYATGNHFAFQGDIYEVIHLITTGATVGSAEIVALLTAGDIALDTANTHTHLEDDGLTLVTDHDGHYHLEVTDHLGNVVDEEVYVDINDAPSVILGGPENFDSGSPITLYFAARDDAGTITDVSIMINDVEIADTILTDGRTIEQTLIDDNTYNHTYTPAGEDQTIVFHIEDNNGATAEVTEMVIVNAVDMTLQAPSGWTFSDTGTSVTTRKGIPATTSSNITLERVGQGEFAQQRQTGISLFSPSGVGYGSISHTGFDSGVNNAVTVRFRMTFPNVGSIEQLTVNGINIHTFSGVATISKSGTQDTEYTNHGTVSNVTSDIPSFDVALNPSSLSVSNSDFEAVPWISGLSAVSGSLSYPSTLTFNYHNSSSQITVTGYTVSAADGSGVNTASGAFAGATVRGSSTTNIFVNGASGRIAHYQ